jgi:hypothetical protein
MHTAHALLIDVLQPVQQSANQGLPALQWSITLGFSECKILGCHIKFFQLSGIALVVLLQ